ncbi:hypothetical protein Ahy_A07g036426 isoform C [Arachis hypogaea]|uniref:FAR1 domain-containing protein n=1 Tax=Arachis hypogaea TaxID=3818 RepID=A0A445CG40_ARAHY|nr:hypothetical protein Ahy_A07g036426 isoform C [Arachis hypogaea]
MAWTTPTGDKCMTEVADVTCCRKGVLSIQEVQLPAPTLGSNQIRVLGPAAASLALGASGPSVEVGASPTAIVLNPSAASSSPPSRTQHQVVARDVVWLRVGATCGVVVAVISPVAIVCSSICSSSKMEYTGHSKEFCMEDESECFGEVVSSDADEFDVEQLDPSGQDDLSDYGDVFGLTAAEIENKVFRTEERAYEFYMRFGKCYGFGVRKGDYGKDDDGNVIRRRFFCNRAGLRDEKHYNRLDGKRCHKPETRTNCQAKLSIYLDKESSIWRVRKVILEHNHDLVARCMVHLIPKFRRVSGAAKDQLDGMQSYGLPTSKILGYMAGIAGGYSLLGFTKKDAYNYLDRTKRARIADGDANSAIVYLEGKASVDPMAMARYN